MVKPPKIDLLNYSPAPHLKFFIKACENYKSAYRARKSKWYNASANRLYYACYQLTLQLLETTGRIKSDSSQSCQHGDMPNFLDDYLRPQFGKTPHPNTLNRCYELRSIADYRHAQVKEYRLNVCFEHFEEFSGFICEIIKKEDQSRL